MLIDILWESLDKERVNEIEAKELLNQKIELTPTNAVR